MWRCAGFAAFLCVAGFVAVSARAQQAADDPSPPTLRSQSRLVVEDVLVMDADGNPVHGLPATAFHLNDNGKPQTIQSFEEGSPDEATPAKPLPARTYSNALPDGPAPVTEVLLIDTDSMAVADQMLLGTHLKKAIAALPPGMLVSLISVRNGRAIPVLLNTTDRAALLRTVDDVVPILNSVSGDRFQSGVNQLMDVAALLQQAPGRKDLLWFAGEFPLIIDPVVDPRVITPDYAKRAHLVHQVVEALAEARVSIFPFDVRGVLVADAVGARQATRPLPERLTSGAALAGHSQMREMAATTGGRAYYLNNLAQEIEQASALAKAAYALSYTPSPYATDESWHRVTISVDGGYTVSYRRGYEATWSGVADVEPRYTLVAGTRQRIDPKRSKPLSFQARIMPGSSPARVTVHFAIPLDDLALPFHDGVYGLKLSVGSSAFDTNGRTKASRTAKVEVHMTAAQYAENRAEGRKVATEQVLDLPKSAKYLLLTVHDVQSQRTGSLLLQPHALEPPAPAAAQQR